MSKTSIHWIFLFSFLFLMPPKFAESARPDLQETTMLLRQEFDRNKPTWKWNEKRRQLTEFYKDRSFEPAWFGESGLKPCVDSIRETLKNADKEGLNPEDYAAAFDESIDTAEASQEILKADIALTTAVLDYIDHLGGERFRNPRKIHRRLHMKPDPVDAPEILREGLAQDPSCEWFRNLTLGKSRYQKLKRLLGIYREIAARGGWPKVTKGPKGLKKGDQGTHVQNLVKRLIADGAALNAQTSVFDEAVESAVKDFQRRHTLEQDGKVGSKTLKALNTTVEQRIKQIIVAMERWRWLPQNPGERYILVNIAGFYLQAIEQDRPVLDMRVIIGRNYRQTPVFSSTIYSIRFNPSWHVPRSIATIDKLPKIQKDPAYLIRGNYVLYDSTGQAISPHSVDWSGVTRGNFPFRLRQRPGSHNALGKIRFSIRSPFNVYLHSTDKKQLFDKTLRTFSSGCIRVAKPKELADFVFNNPQEWPMEVISKNMDGYKTRNVALKNPTPVHITYFTVWMDESGTPHFTEDIYKQDESLIRALRL